MDELRSPAEVLRDWRYYQEFGSGGPRSVASYRNGGSNRIDLLTSGLRGVLAAAFAKEVNADEVPSTEGLQSLKEILAARNKPAPQPNAPPETLPAPSTAPAMVNPVVPSVAPVEAPMVEPALAERPLSTPMTPTVMYERAVFRAIVAGVVVGIIIGVFWLLA